MIPIPKQLKNINNLVSVFTVPMNNSEVVFAILESLCQCILKHFQDISVVVLSEGCYIRHFASLAMVVDEPVQFTVYTKQNFILNTTIETETCLRTHTYIYPYSTYAHTHTQTHTSRAIVQWFIFFHVVIIICCQISKKRQLINILKA